MYFESLTICNKWKVQKTKEAGNDVSMNFHEVFQSVVVLILHEACLCCLLA